VYGWILGPVRAVKRAVPDGLAEMVRLDVFGEIEVGDGAGDLENTVMGAGGEVEANDSILQQLFAVGSIDGA
jgi:hypothetical protein